MSALTSSGISITLAKIAQSVQCLSMILPQFLSCNLIEKQNNYLMEVYYGPTGKNTEGNKTYTYNVCA